MRFWLTIFAFAFYGQVSAQTSFDGINLQGELSNEISASEIDLDIIFLSLQNDTLYHEVHQNMPLYGENNFTLVLGQGTFLNGNYSTLNNLNWFEVSEIEILYQNELIGSYNLSTLPYAYHSQNTIFVPKVIDLTDTPGNILNSNVLLKYDGISFYESSHFFNDSIYFAYSTSQSIYSDTAINALNNLFSDSSYLALFSDSTSYSNNVYYSFNTEHSTYSSQSSFSNNAINNWHFNGNNNTSGLSYAGTQQLSDFIFRTHNQNRFVINQLGGIGTYNTSSGFNIENNGVLFNLNQLIFIPTLSNHHFYFDASNSAVHMGSSISNMDTLLGYSSFAFGNNVGTNGTYSTVFGSNSFGDSSNVFGTMYGSISSFIVGKNCNATYVGVAIGENCKAIFYRNVAMGKDVYVGQTSANLPSAAIGVGNNVVSSGSTSWAMGHNVSATGHFSYALGTNASTNMQNGSFVYGDGSTNDTITNTGANQFFVRSSGGTIFYTTSDLSMGVSVSNGGGSWNTISDSSKKSNIHPLVYSKISKQINQTPVYSWTYNTNSTQHLGPMAQDFNTNFSVGELPNYINSGDMDGIILSGIKNIKIQVDEKDNEKLIEEKNKEIEEEKAKLEALQKKIDELYEKYNH
ncbi:MAG: tail fiber domain-containing protein [Putridiphycobacter sp.]